MSENGERVAQTPGMKSLQFHNCGIIDDDIWFYYRISLYFISFLPGMPVDKNHLKLPHVSIFKLYCHLTMSYYWYYQYFINIIFILSLYELKEGVEWGSHWVLWKLYVNGEMKGKYETERAWRHIIWSKCIRIVLVLHKRDVESSCMRYFTFQS